MNTKRKKRKKYVGGGTSNLNLLYLQTHSKQIKLSNLQHRTFSSIISKKRKEKLLGQNEMFNKGHNF